MLNNKTRLTVYLSLLGLIGFLVIAFTVPFQKRGLAQKFQKPLLSAQAPTNTPRGVAGDLWADNVIGQINFNQAVPNEVVPFKTFNPGGVTVDRSSRPNKIYVYDGANSRVLGYSSLGVCSNNNSVKCTTNSDCGGETCDVSARKDADIVFGQPGKTGYSGCNNYGSMENYPLRAPSSVNFMLNSPNAK